MALKPCPNCKKDISELAEKCPKCGTDLKPSATELSGIAGTFNKAYNESNDVFHAAKAVLNSIPPAPEKPKPEYDQKTQVKEFKRTCKQCGKVWHSLSEREDELKGRLNPCKPECCGGTEGAGATQCRKGCLGVAGPDSDESVTNTLESLKKCPGCSSGNYSEEAIIYERKK